MTTPTIRTRATWTIIGAVVGTVIHFVASAFPDTAEPIDDVLGEVCPPCECADDAAEGSGSAP